MWGYQTQTLAAAASEGHTDCQSSEARLLWAPVGKGRAGAPQPGVNPGGLGCWASGRHADQLQGLHQKRSQTTFHTPAACSLADPQPADPQQRWEWRWKPQLGALWQGAESVPPLYHHTAGAETHRVNAPVCPHLPAGRLAVLIMRLSAGSDAEGLCAAPRAPVAQRGWDSPGLLPALGSFP